MTRIEVKMLRKSLGVSQFQLEKLSGVSRNKIALYEQGYRKLELFEIERLVLAVKKAEKFRVEGGGI